MKTKEILYYFSKIAHAFQTRILVNSFAPYHGHSVCDAHFGAGKRMLRQNVGTGVVESEMTKHYLVNETERQSLLAKTLDFEAVKKAVEGIHSYAVPCILKIDATGSEKYMGWVRKETTLPNQRA